jgi:hypothetical protein
VAQANEDFNALKEAAQEYDTKRAKLEREIRVVAGKVDSVLERQRQVMEEALMDQVGGGAGGRGWQAVCMMGACVQLGWRPGLLVQHFGCGAWRCGAVVHGAAAVQGSVRLGMWAM